MKAKQFTLFAVSVAMALAIVLGGCRPSAPAATPVPSMPTAMPPTITPAPPTPTALLPTLTATPAPIPEPPEAIEFIVWQLAGQLHLPGQVHLVRWEQVDWPNGCLGIPMRDACTQAIVPGYRIVVEIGDQEYEYRSTLPDAQPYRLLLAAGPGHGIEEPALQWEGQEDGGCQSLLLAADGRAAIGPCDAPHTPLYHFAHLHFLDFWKQHWLRRFAPFQAETPAGRVIFQGQGQEVASPAWQRAIAAWARLVQQELVFGRSGASWGAALAWHREMPGRPGYCQFLHVEMYGLAYASVARCGGGDAQDLGQGWLETAEWEQFEAWFYGRAPVYQQGLDFFSAGTQEMSDSEVDALRRWAEAVYSHLTVETPAPTPTTIISAGWKTYSSPAFGVALEYPAHWEYRPGYGESYGGKDGLFGLNAVSGEGVPLDEVAQRSAYHKLQPYGSQPKIESMKVQGQPARLILPSADQPEDMKGQAELIVLYPQPVTISGEWYRYFVLYADQSHIRQIAETLSFVK